MRVINHFYVPQRALLVSLSPTRPNPKHSEKSTLLDLFLTNMPQKYKSTAVFANDMSDHCVIAGVRDERFHSFCPQGV